MSKSIYICYFGMREPLVQTQVIPYLREILREGEKGRRGEGEWRVSLLTFEPLPGGESGTSEEWESEIKSELAEQGIEWHWLRYHKRPTVPATFYDVMNGARVVRSMLRQERFDILHSRGHVPAVMAALVRKGMRHRPKILFDIRGFVPEEYTDAGLWPEGGWLYRSVKRMERWLMREADGFVVLTEKAREILFPSDEGRVTSDEASGQQSAVSGQQSAVSSQQSAVSSQRFKNPPATTGGSDNRPVEVIPCCVDFESRFSVDWAQLRAATRKRLGIEDRFVITHLGALGGLYLTEQLADLLAAARSLDAWTFAMFLTQSDPDLILPLLRERGFSSTDHFVAKIAPADVAEYLEAADVGLSFVKASYATASRSPTKIPEYLACGLPIIANRGVGDVDALIEENRIGALVDEFSHKAYVKALREIEALGNVNERCREVARLEFDLETVGGVRYKRIYQKLTE